MRNSWYTRKQAYHVCEPWESLAVAIGVHMLEEIKSFPQSAWKRTRRVYIQQSLSLPHSADTEEEKSNKNTAAATRWGGDGVEL